MHRDLVAVDAGKFNLPKPGAELDVADLLLQAAAHPEPLFFKLCGSVAAQRTVQVRAGAPSKVAASLFASPGLRSIETCLHSTAQSRL